MIETVPVGPIPWKAGVLAARTAESAIAGNGDLEKWKIFCVNFVFVFYPMFVE
jgi:hypothetical protein